MEKLGSSTRVYALEMSKPSAARISYSIDSTSLRVNTIMSESNKTEKQITVAVVI